ncbi:2-polyprenyl-6-methoxyphenol hydroxylase-like FAD-dependent oxidoreductase [Archangium gephyra]|uniref:2-polyprenyl-6-methoxyphenol hydroxylase-like FAD-dependent oxidoreductase n=1 Tax=Archangium gephyra TaxID=48 RepID=A0AAC8TE53_9BACT|nr:FAD-dependent oxidoreductase [Archangium gephyra]AKJ02532.1 Hypothetical protein AA314_04158 [Archangium gephyra]REG28547.1 2-polyprenyl-6-methoxyphenol hydroxylase-like FAD-dependent oxidoreductase [Archangium gephyra]
MSTSNSISSKPIGKHAIVYGGSMSGLTAAGMLARHFERVTLVERDVFEDGPKHRKGVPQAQHYHGMLMRGINILGDIFPGIREDLRAAGAQTLDMCRDTAWYKGDVWCPRFPSAIDHVSLSRPLLEWLVRKRVMALPNVHILSGREATGFLMSADHSRLTGVRIQAPGGGQEETLEGELVVDTTGRGSRTPQWLEALGFPRVEETRIQVDVGYATRSFQLPADLKPDWKLLSVTPDMPRTRRFGVMAAIESGRFMVCLGGWLGEHPPADEAGFLEFARNLPQPHIHEALRLAEPLSPISFHRFPHHQRRYYERMSRFPEGLVVVGDAVCSFNPIYGQGITVGALQVETLGACLGQGLESVSLRYRRGLEKTLSVPWTLATSGDLLFPEVQAVRPPGFAVTSWLGTQVQRLASHDHEALLTFQRVMHMVEPPTALFSPRMMLKMLLSRPEASAPNRAPELLAPARSQAA